MFTKIKLLVIISILLVINSNAVIGVYGGLDNSLIPIGSLSCSLSGCVMSGDIDMNGYAIYNVTFVNVTFNQTITINSSQVLNPIWLNLTDQRYNESDMIQSVNDSVNDRVFRTGDTMTGDLNMSNNSILDVYVLSVHNITGRSPITINNDLIGLGSNFFADNFYGNFNGSNGTIFGVTINNGTIINLHVVNDSYFDQNVFVNGSVNASNYNLFGDNVWIYKDNLVFYFNESKFNESLNNSLNLSNVYALISSVNNTLFQEIQDRQDNDTYIIGLITSVNDTLVLVNQSIWSELNNKLNTSDQRYNETTYIYNVNLSLSNQLDNKLNTTDQRYNDTVYINNLNESLQAQLNFKLNESDQRYNDTYILNYTKQGDQVYLYNNSNTIYLNETKLNTTINSIAQNQVQTYNFTLTTGNYSGLSNINISYQITQITVIPGSNTTSYRFELLEYPSYNVIERDLVPHKKIWNIEKSYALNNPILANITQSSPDDTYFVSVKYLFNGVSI